MDSEKTSLPTIPEVGENTMPVSLSSVAFAEEGGERFVRFTAQRELSSPLSSFTVAYRFSGTVGNSVKESRYFSLTFDREGINTKETITMRIRVPDGYNAIGCTAYISKIAYADGCEASVAEENAQSVSCRLAGVDSVTGKKTLPRAAKTLIAVSVAVLTVAGAVFGGIYLSDYLSVKTVVNSLIDDGRYGEAYKIAGECSGVILEKTAADNIISKCLGERDFKTAYIYASLVGKEKTVFSRVEYEFSASGADALTSDAFAVLRKLDDEEFDETLTVFIRRMEEAGEYPTAMTADTYIRDEKTRGELRRELIVNGVCHYAASSELTGMAKYDRALEYLACYGNNGDAALAEEIVDRSLSSGDCAGAVVLSSYFSGMFDGFTTDPASIVITPHNASIARSLDYAYPLLTDSQKRAYHADTFALSEEPVIIRNGTVAGTDVKNAVSVATYENRTAVLCADGRVVHVKNGSHNTTSNVPADVNGVQVAVGLAHTVILNSDGTVTAVGDNTYGQCGTKDWRDIVEVAAGRNFTLGLKSDGTLLACGSDKCGTLLVTGFSNVISIEACDQTAVLLFSDGTVMLRGEQSMGLRDANKITNAEQIKAGGSAVIALLSDGTFVLADGSVGRCGGSVDSWTADSVADFAAGSQCIGYVDRSGYITMTGDGAPK